MGFWEVANCKPFRHAWEVNLFFNSINLDYLRVISFFPLFFKLGRVIFSNLVLEWDNLPRNFCIALQHLQCINVSYPSSLRRWICLTHGQGVLAEWWDIEPPWWGYHLSIFNFIYLWIIFFVILLLWENVSKDQL